jgi:hypothetical protein
LYAWSKKEVAECVLRLGLCVEIEGDDDISLSQWCDDDVQGYSSKAPKDEPPTNDDNDDNDGTDYNESSTSASTCISVRIVMRNPSFYIAMFSLMRTNK